MDTFPELGLYPFDPGESDPARADQSRIDKYCRRSVRTRSQSVHELVPYGAEVDGQRVREVQPADAGQVQVQRIACRCSRS